ncbi:MAG: hypothetical protein KDC92_03780 [Bacteroidetes bacterium]|nr:hypothetical protein [Bacteroidota bacterium]
MRKIAKRIIYVVVVLAFMSCDSNSANQEAAKTVKKSAHKTYGGGLLPVPIYPFISTEEEAV